MDIPGNPPFVFLSQITVSFVVVVVSSSGADEEWYMVTVKIPPVVGIRATSPRSVLKVERSSWANWFFVQYSLSYLEKDNVRSHT